MEYDYMKDLSIDPHDLPEEWMKQPVLFMQYIELASNACKLRDQAKENVDVVKAEVDAQIRKNPELFGVVKITENQVSNIILTNDRYKEAVSALHDANLKYALLQGAVRAFEQRKSALENEVKMLLGGIYSVPNEGQQIAAGRRIMEHAVEAASQEQRNGLQAARERNNSSKESEEETLVRRRRPS